MMNHSITHYEHMRYVDAVRACKNILELLRGFERHVNQSVTAAGLEIAELSAAQ